MRQFSQIDDSTPSMSIDDSRVFSNPNAKFVQCLLRWYPSPRVRRLLYAGNTFAAVDSGAAVGDYRVTYYYFSEATTISGSVRVAFYLPYDTLTYISEYSVNIGAGWNSIITKISSTDLTTRTFQISAGDDSGKKWYDVSIISETFRRADIL